MRVVTPISSYIFKKQQLTISLKIKLNFTQKRFFRSSAMSLKGGGTFVFSSTRFATPCNIYQLSFSRFNSSVFVQSFSIPTTVANNTPTRGVSFLAGSVTREPRVSATTFVRSNVPVEFIVKTSNNVSSSSNLNDDVNDVSVFSVDTTGYHKTVVGEVCKIDYCLNQNCANLKEIDKPCSLDDDLQKDKGVRIILGNFTSNRKKGMPGFTVNQTENYSGQQKGQELMVDRRFQQVPREHFIQNQAATAYSQKKENHDAILNTKISSSGTTLKEDLKLEILRSANDITLKAATDNVDDDHDEEN